MIASVIPLLLQFVPTLLLNQLEAETSFQSGIKGFTNPWVQRKVVHMGVIIPYVVSVLQNFIANKTMQNAIEIEGGIKPLLSLMSSCNRYLASLAIQQNRDTLCHQTKP